MYQVEPLAKHHEKQKFDCGNEPLNRYLQQYANQHAKKGLSKTYVLVGVDNPNEILGYYSISTNALRDIAIEGYPTNLDLPCVLIGRLAVASHVKGKGVSTLLMVSAIERIKQLSLDVGIAVITVDLKHHGLIDFYSRYGFKQIIPNSLTMYLKLSSI